MTDRTFGPETTFGTYRTPNPIIRPESAYDGRVSERCALGCVDGEGCGASGPYTSWCGGCCACRGGCRAGYYEQVEEVRAGEAAVTTSGEHDGRRAAMLARRAELSRAHPEITMAAELAPLMGDLEPEYWDWQLERYFAQELGEGDG